MLDIFLPRPCDDPMARRLSALREEAEASGQHLLSHLIEVAQMEAEKIVETRREGLLVRARRLDLDVGRERD